MRSSFVMPPKIDPSSEFNPGGAEKLAIVALSLAVGVVIVVALTRRGVAVGVDQVIQRAIDAGARSIHSVVLEVLVERLVFTARVAQVNDKGVRS